MMTCKAVSTLVSTGELARAPLRRRVAVWLHLAMCRHCRAFRRQLDMMARAAVIVAEAFEAEPSPDFERRTIDRLHA